MALEKEMQTYTAKLAEMKAEHEGKFVLIHEADIVGFFAAYEDALKQGYEKFGVKPFLVKQIKSFEQAQFISRHVAFSASAL